MEDFDNRKCYCIIDVDDHNVLACRKRLTGEIFKVDGYEMTDIELPDAKFKRWATGFDV